MDENILKDKNKKYSCKLVLSIPTKLQTFVDFLDDTRMIMLTQRNKEGGKVTKPDRVAKKKITKNREEFIKVFNEFESFKNNTNVPLRIYSCVNKRNIDKAIREFKYRMLEADYYDEISRRSFYYDIKNRWMSCVMSPTSRAETNFIIDIDDNNLTVKTLRELQSLKVKVILHYNTKNGSHVVTEPFNPNLLKTKYPELGIAKDGLLLLSY